MRERKKGKINAICASEKKKDRKEESVCVKERETREKEGNGEELTEEKRCSRIKHRN